VVQSPPPNLGPARKPYVPCSNQRCGLIRSVYAIVQYDFAAERPDELDAKKGEPIVVIAQSNHEW
jgi:bud emergence protein 1